MSDFPRTADAITSEWLTGVLRDSGDMGESAVQSFDMSRVGEDSGMAGDIYRLDIKHRTNTEEAPNSLIVKLPRADMPANPVISQMADREIRFYNQLASDSGVRSPRHYHSEFDHSNGQFIILLEDLSDLRTVSPLDGCNYDEAAAALNSIAGMHARHWNDASLTEKTWLLDRIIPTDLEIASKRFMDGFDEFLKISGDHLPHGIESIGRNFGPAIPAVIESAIAPPFTLIHGDFSSSNVFFGTTEAPAEGFVAYDWQMVGRAKAASDIGLFLMHSLTTQTRREHEDALVAEYHTTLVSHGVKDYSLDELWTDIRIGVLPRFIGRVNVTLRVAQRMMKSEAGRKNTESVWERLQTLVDWDCGEVIPQ